MKQFYLIRVLFKKFLGRVLPYGIESFCKCCGRKVHDFHAPDEIWEKVEPHIRFGHVLCYDCFCEICRKLGLPATWKLEGV